MIYIKRKIILNIKNEIEESCVPFYVDIVDFSNMSILSEYFIEFEHIKTAQLNFANNP